jgi:tetratricopeptide (TPR) repeat protein
VRLSSIALAAVCGVFHGVAHADTTEAQQYNDCANLDGHVSHEQQIAACTYMIKRPVQTKQALAVGHNDRGIAYKQQGDYVHAIGDYTEAIQYFPKYEPFYCNRGNAYYAQGDHKRALADYDHAALLNPKDKCLHYGRCLVYQAQKEYPKAVVSCTEALRIDPQLRKALATRGTVHQAAQDYGLAKADFDELIRLDPMSAIAFNNRGNAFLSLHELVSAKADFDEALRLDPSDAVAFANRAMVYYAQHDYARALADADSAAQISPGEARYQNQRCWYRALAHRELDVARTACDTAVRLEPHNAKTLDSRGMLGLVEGRNQDAWTDYDAAVRTERSASNLYGRGIASLRLGHTAEGQQDLEQARQLSPEIGRTYADYGITP